MSGKSLCVIFLLLITTAYGQQSLKTYSILPSDTDKAIDSFNLPHSAYFNPAVKSRDQLVVFLPGSGGSGRGGVLFSQTAAEQGFHVISLSYPTDISASICRNEEDKDCFENFRMEIITGEDKSALIAVNRANSIENRLQKLLIYLKENHGSEGWGKYLTAENTIKWDELILSGQSQGGGHAPLIAKYHKVSRVVMFSSPKDYSIKYNHPAKWYGQGATPASGFYAFEHIQDKQACSYLQQLEILKTMGLYNFGEPVNIDNVAAPYKSSHVLVTNYPDTPVTSGEAHTSTMGDARTPKGENGEPLFKPVWIYMLTNE